jgi:hypothetical protein
MDEPNLDILTDWLYLPPSYGMAGLNSLCRWADEELLGSFAAIAVSLISFCRKTELPVYIGIAEALEAMGDAANILEEVVSPSPEYPCESIDANRALSARATECTSLSTEQELTWPLRLSGVTPSWRYRAHGIGLKTRHLPRLCSLKRGLSWILLLPRASKKLVS